MRRRERREREVEREREARALGSGVELSACGAPSGGQANQGGGDIVKLRWQVAIQGLLCFFVHVYYE